MPPKKDFVKLPNAQTSNIDVPEPNMQPQQNVSVPKNFEYEPYRVDAPKQAIDQQVKLGQRQIQQTYDEKMYQLRHLQLTDDEYYTSVNQLKEETKAAELNIRQKADQTLLAMNQIETMANEGIIPEETAVQAKYRLAGLPAPKSEGPIDLAKEWKELDSYRKGLEKRLEKFSRPRIEKRPSAVGLGIAGFFMEKTSVPGDVIVTERVYDEKEGKYRHVAHKATPEEQQERVRLMQEASRVRTKQLGILEMSGLVNEATVKSLKTANRLQTALDRKAVEYHERRTKDDPMGIFR